MLGVIVVMRHRRSPLPWVSAIATAARRTGTWLRRGTFEIGLDLRGVPRVRRGSPPIVVRLATALALWAIAAACLAPYCPHGFRTAVAGVFYLGYLTVLSGIWFGLIALGLLAAFLPFALIHDRCVGSFFGPGPRPRKREAVALGVYFGLLAVAGTTFSASVALAWCGLILIVYLAICWLPARGDVRFLWRPYGTIRVRSLPWGAWVTWEFLLITLAIVALVLTALGDRIAGGGPCRRRCR